MKILSALLLGLCGLVSAAGRVSPPDLGMSVYVPAGWKLYRDTATVSLRRYLLEDTVRLNDTTPRHPAILVFEVRSGVKNTGTATAWVDQEVSDFLLWVQGEPFNATILNSSMPNNGLYGREIWVEYADENFIDFVEEYQRFTANGDIGWSLNFTTDSTDLDTSGGLYSALFDSAKANLSFQALPMSGVLARPSQVAPMGLRSGPEGLRIQSGFEGAIELEVMDLAGRVQKGRLSTLGGGNWLWKPDQDWNGTVVVRVRSGSRAWTGRSVLTR